jgi:hypothetical protein
MELTRLVKGTNLRSFSSICHASSAGPEDRLKPSGQDAGRALWIYKLENEIYFVISRLNNISHNSTFVILLRVLDDHEKLVPIACSGFWPRYLTLIQPNAVASRSPFQAGAATALRHILMKISCGREGSGEKSQQERKEISILEHTESYAPSSSISRRSPCSKLCRAPLLFPLVHKPRRRNGPNLHQQA